jgi:hypothetical protein
MAGGSRVLCRGYWINPVQSSTTLPVWPERIAVKPWSNSA